MAMDYESRKQAILASSSIEELKRSQNMPPVPLCEEEQNFVFISYSHKDYKAVYCDLLEFHKNGLRYWYDEGLPAGEAWDKVVEGQIKHPNCAGVIFYMSENLFLSRSVNKEVEYTVGSEEGDEKKNYFCINLSDMPPMKIIFNIQRTREYEELEQSGFMDCLPCLTRAFSNKATYIPKAGDGDAGHIPATLKQIRERFGVFIDGAPIANDAEMQKLAKELDIAKNFAIKNGILLKYMGEDTEVVIPDGVRTIGKGAFENCWRITKVVIPEGVKWIYEQAFVGCGKLSECNIPDSVIRVEKEAFYGCYDLIKYDRGAFYIGHWLVYCDVYGLSGINIRPGTKKIADSAFENCKTLEYITIPDSVTSIGEEAFSGCTGLTSITIPNSVTRIGDYEFKGCTGLTSITIPDSVTSIGDCAFQGCTGLKSVTIGSSVISIDSSAFSGCTSLTSITIPDSVTIIGNSAFYDCTGLTSITIPDSVTSIGDGAFAGCTGLTSITIGDSVTKIGERAFWGCTGLTSITIPNSVTSIDDQAFENCTGLEAVYIEDLVAWCRIWFYDSSSNPLVFAGKLYLDNNLVNELVIPDSVTSIGKYVFAGCTELTSITIPESVNSIGSSAFGDCTGLTSVTIPDSVTSIGNSAFYGCTGLTSITIPNSVTSIDHAVFAGCIGLTSITIPDSVTGIGEWAFKGCTRLKSITIPNRVTSIGRMAFEGCTGLTSITIPDSVTSIGDGAFAGCAGIRSISAAEGNRSYHCRDNCLIKTATGVLVTGSATSIIPTDGSITGIENRAFYGCTRLKSITIPNSVTSIGFGAFKGCTGLTSITIPDSVTSIGKWAFSGCTGLTSINFSGTVKQWISIDKEEGWDFSSGDYTIHCIDGDIRKGEA